jgi:hypothetical protein
VTIDVIADCRLPIADLKSGSSVIRLSPLKWPYPAHLERFPGYGGKELGIFFQSAIGNRQLRPGRASKLKNPSIWPCVGNSLKVLSNMCNL